MASIPRISESSLGEKVRPLDVWRAKLEVTLRRAEKQASLYVEAKRQGNEQWARNNYKMARFEAREASKMIGVLEIEFGAGMAQEVERARNVFAQLV